MGLESNVYNGSGDAEEGDSAGATMAETPTRIFVGGLGANVTADDIRKTFSSLGDLESIEIVRSKGRSFAHLDFVPSSRNSLSKLFSMYNGCVWKGGKLKLEKAKEHYLLRLKREWTEDVKLEKKAPTKVVEPAKELVTPGKFGKVLSSEKIQLRLFFPKLGKVKTIPFSGSGKHKYSFQRLQVPPLPNHFCDCEEHSNPSYNIKEKHVHDTETQSGGVNEEELSMMETVMNKLFEKKNVSKSGHIRVEPALLEVNSTKSIDDPLEDNSANSIDGLLVTDDVDHVSDDDNLVMNMVVGNNDIMLLRGSTGPKTTTHKEEQLFGETQASVHKTTRTHKGQENEIVASNKKRKISSTDNKDGNEFVSDLPERKRNSQSRLSKLEKSREDKGKRPRSDVEQSNTKPTWSQKSAWRDLVGVEGNKSFHVTDITPIGAATRGEEPESVVPSVPSSPENEENNIENHENFDTVITPIGAATGGEKPESASHENEEKNIENHENSDTDITPIDAATGGEKLESASRENEEKNIENHENFDVIPEKSKELKRPADNHPTKANEVAKNSGRGASWLQKSSWTQLVGQKNTNSFSISQILPGIAFKEHDIEAPNNAKVANSTGGIKNASVTDGSKALKVDEDVRNDQNISTKFGLAKKEKDRAVEIIVGENKSILAPSNQISTGNLGASETCPFMRNPASLKEWAKTKAALSGSSKKKSEEK